MATRYRDEPKRSGRWTEEFLESMRHECDPPADDIIADYFGGQSAVSAHGFFNELMNYRIERRSGFEDDEIPMPKTLVDKLVSRDPPPVVEPAVVARAQRLFRDYGPEILTMLGYYSLPTAYGAANGVHVLAATGYLEHRVMRRLIETTQLVIDVLKTDGLSSGGDGFQSAAEVRLMHGAIRYLIRNNYVGWRQEWGDPINQEDLAGTLMTFSTLVLFGFKKLNVHLSGETQESFMSAWGAVGRALGIREALIPDDYAQARELWSLIRARQVRGSEVGQRLMKALLAAVSKQIPTPFAKDLGPSIVRFYLDPKLADGLAVPRNVLFDGIGQMFGTAYGALDNLAHSFPLGREAYRWFARNYILALTISGRGHESRAPFDLPLELSDFWKVPSPNRAVANVFS